MSGNKALKRAFQTKDVERLVTPLPLITDETVLITPAIAEEMLKRNKKNRPVNWNKVIIYAQIMLRGEWKLHSQGIIFDQNGNLLTGQNRLWAVLHSGCSVYMRVSRGNPSDVANLLDRGSPQSARDLSTRETQRKHSPVESMIARGILALDGDLRPSVDAIGRMITRNSEVALAILKQTTGTKKTRSVIMILAAICAVVRNTDESVALARLVPGLSEELDEALKPATADKCWGKGAAFAMAMTQAKKCIDSAKAKREGWGSQSNAVV